MHDPTLRELELALTYRCDVMLASEAVLEQGEVRVAVHWLYRGREYRARLVVPPGRRIPWYHWLRWFLGGRRFDVLPLAPSFEMYSKQGWSRAVTLDQWRAMLDLWGGNPGKEPPAHPRDGLAGRPVGPRPGSPLLRSGAAAIPRRLIEKDEHYPVLPLRRRTSEE